MQLENQLQLQCNDQSVTFINFEMSSLPKQLKGFQKSYPKYYLQAMDCPTLTRAALGSPAERVALGGYYPPPLCQLANQQP